MIWLHPKDLPLAIAAARPPTVESFDVELHDGDDLNTTYVVCRKRISGC